MARESCIAFSGWPGGWHGRERCSSKDFSKQVLGYGLTTAEIVYRRPDRHWLLQTYVWQDYDLFPNFPALKDFLAFWETKLEGPLFAVTVAHSMIKPAELRAVDGVFRLH
ncbi:Usg protein (tryptophan operon, function unknown) [Bradyrhizobium erythrophlei]|uniref:Protein usg n=1 Tax=Bradyrhizobium erythrophlei TaxID=1437360 RepID=A0A1M5SS05_9BRAD|nr:Usg protein (tryptophan operon, function unknown) [Bradyrhizobium erythrophlei]